MITPDWQLIFSKIKPPFMSRRYCVGCFDGLLKHAFGGCQKGFLKGARVHQKLSEHFGSKKLQIEDLARASNFEGKLILLNLKSIKLKVSKSSASDRLSNIHFSIYRSAFRVAVWPATASRNRVTNCSIQTFDS